MNRFDNPRSMRMRKQSKNQAGMTGIGIALILGLIAFFALIALKLFPIYMENFSVNTHLNNLTEDSAIKKMSNGEIREKLQKSFKVDRVKNVGNENVFIERNSSGFVVAIEYEVRTSTIGNVDMVVSFSEEVEIN